MTISFFMTPLDPSCSVVLGYNWLTRYNPLIDWVLGSIKFQPHLLDSSPLTSTSTARAAMLPLQNRVSDETPKHSEPTPRISMIGAAAFMHASKHNGSQCFSLHLSDPSSQQNQPLSPIKLQTSPRSPKSTTIMPMYSVNPKQANLLRIARTT